ncbi:2-amino-4-oxopentanoate thiolase subunit OrtA [Halarsenatibacter silvermanii]|uniref:2-amino-4-ketopentanoate thiolase alpha subunit n=1 Tax=Halarsenatibacter silvermanii TaxID=321763 RepID=A0A1G9QRQ4_9FIRM|nr:2-amino-4-oxopentanoate thiolase subunit OrtA [Halarsenatibacter silvermanii]SDM13674.1 hypothetical protein SAMN04488692_1184 [Halarsenatibacter silvermanii]
MTKKVPRGSWVEIKKIVLEPGSRAPQVPEDTARVPLEMRIKGYLTSPAAKGDEVEIRTVIGNRYEGVLHDSDPSYDHKYGKPVPELITIGEELKQILSADGGE